MRSRTIVSYLWYIPDNSLEDVSLDQLKAVYKGEIKNWKDLGGADKKITVVSRDTSSGTYEVWKKIVMKEERVFPGALVQASNGAVAQAVAKNEYAIGYVGIGYLNKELKALKVNGIVGTAASALDGSFPVSRPLFMFTPGWPEGETNQFINFVLHPEKGQKLVEDAGYVPLY